MRVAQSIRYGFMLPSQNQQKTNTNLEQSIFPPQSALKTEDSQCLEKVRSYYDKMSPIVLKNVGTTYQAGLLMTESGDNPYRATNLYCATQAGIQPGDRVLDGGCGVCGPSIDIALSIEGVKIDGITISPVQADTARTLVQQAGLTDRIQVWVGDYHKLPFAKETFDIVIFLESTGYSYNLQSLFAEVDRVLRPIVQLA